MHSRAPPEVWSALRHSAIMLMLLWRLRCMQERLNSLHADVASARAGHTPQRCEQAIAMSALACFLAYLTGGATAHKSSLYLDIGCINLSSPNSAYFPYCVRALHASNSPQTGLHQEILYATQVAPISQIKWLMCSGHMGTHALRQTGPCRCTGGVQVQCRCANVCDT